LIAAETVIEHTAVINCMPNFISSSEPSHFASQLSAQEIAFLDQVDHLAVL